MASGSVGARKRSGSVGDLLLGSWPRTVVAAGLIALLVVAGLIAYASGWLGSLRYASFPGHPYPPAGYYQNPFNPRDRGDLINDADAGRVKAELLRDGDLELQAFEVGDASLLPQAETGRALKAAQELLTSNASKGVVERAQNNLDRVVVGRLADPNDPTITWCVEERGTSLITFIDKSTGNTVQSQNVRFGAKYWMVQAGGRYLIADVAINTTPLGSS